jgi:hypothetical protein
MGGAQSKNPKGNRRSVRAIHINAGLLAAALAPLIFGLCSNIVTGGSFSDALDERDWWVYPFLIVSGAIYLICNYKEAEKAVDDPSQMSPGKLGEYATEALPSVMKAARRALAGTPVPQSEDDEFGYRTEREYSTETPETLQGLIVDLFAPVGSQSKRVAVMAAWRLAALMDSDNVRVGLDELVLTDDQLHQPRLKWLVRPSENPTHPSEPLSLAGLVGRSESWLS